MNLPCSGIVKVMKKILKILLKITAGAILLMLIAFAVIYAVYNKPLPTGNEGRAADELAEKLLKSINFEAYQNTRFLEWSFASGSHHYIWDKANGKVQVEWATYKVNLNLVNGAQSEVFQNNERVTGSDRLQRIKTATDYFNNDSFWLVAPFKVFDKGTKRSLVTKDDGSEALLVTYTDGGTTPGDSYLWNLDTSGFPLSYQMWVQIIPIGGIEASWDGWQVMESGVFLPTTHKLGPITLNMGEIRGHN